MAASRPIAFEGEGCTISQAAAELVADESQGRTLDEIEAMSHDEIVDLLGREVVMSRPALRHPGARHAEGGDQAVPHRPAQRRLPGIGVAHGSLARRAF